MPRFYETNKKKQDIIVLKRVGTMANHQKILKALRSALAYTDDSVLAVDKKDGGRLENGIWHVAAELEYALFLFSLKAQDEIDRSKWKLNPRIDKVEAGPILARVRDLLDKCDESLRKKEFLDAFRDAYVARRCLLMVQKDFAKKKREALRKKK